MKVDNERLSKTSRGMRALFYALRYPKIIVPIIKPTFSSLFAAGAYKKKKLPSIEVADILNNDHSITLQNCHVRNGNVSYIELILISLIAKKKFAKNLVEIGTFDGNTTLQLALNSSQDAIVHTLDLPPNNPSNRAPVLKREMKFIFDKGKKIRKYQNTSVEAKVVQHLGDSADYDFSKFCKESNIDFCFIDGSHSYEYVKNDSSRIMQYLAKEGVIIWHDYTPNYPGVFRLLNELQKNYPIYHIEGTSLAIYTTKLEKVLK